MYRAPKYRIAAQQPSEESIIMSLFARRRRVPQKQHCGFIHEREEAEVAGVLARGFVDEEGFRAQTARAEQKNHTASLISSYP
jgi:hypothetical protein